MIDSEGKFVIRTDMAHRITKAYTDLSNSAQVARDDSIKELDTVMEKIVFLSVFTPQIPELKHFAVDIFTNLRSLELDMCPPSTVLGLYNARSSLETLKISNSGIPDIFSSFAPFQRKMLRRLSPMIFPDSVCAIPTKFLWSNLLVLQLSNCGISKLDESFHFFPRIEYLNLSHNDIAHVIHLQDCIDLKFLNLSHNRIRVLSNLERVLGSVERINLAHNRIESLDGIDRIYSLERLDVAHNSINDFAEITHLCKLPNIDMIRLKGNPIAAMQHYRLKIFAEMIGEGTIMQGDRSLPVLDWKPMSSKERRFFRRVMFRTTTHSEATFSHFDAAFFEEEDDQDQYEGAGDMYDDDDHDGEGGGGGGGDTSRDLSAMSDDAMSNWEDLPNLVIRQRNNNNNNNNNDNTTNFNPPSHFPSHLHPNPTQAPLVVARAHGEQPLPICRGAHTAGAQRSSGHAQEVVWHAHRQVTAGVH